MQLQDMENDVLIQMQQPGAANIGSGAPNWSALTNPQFAQNTVDFYLNQGYKRVAADMSEFDLMLITGYFPSVAGQSTYNINPIVSSQYGAIAATIPSGVSVGTQTVTPSNMNNITLGTPLFIGTPPLPSGQIVFVTAVTATTFTATFTKAQFNVPQVSGVTWPNCKRIQRAYYSPQGLGYTQEYEPGGDLISWREFQRYTDHGFLTNTSSATQPGKMAVTPDRTQLAMYSAPASSGDLVTVQFAPLPTAGAYICPTLINETDTPLLPDDGYCHEAIVQWALSFLWLLEREVGMAQAAKQNYRDLINSAKEAYLLRSQGDSLQFEERGMALGVLGSVGGLQGGP